MITTCLRRKSLDSMNTRNWNTGTTDNENTPHNPSPATFKRENKNEKTTTIPTNITDPRPLCLR